MKSTASTFALPVARWSWLALLLLCVLWELWLAPLRPNGSWLWVKALPIAFTLPGVWRGHAQSLQVALLLSAFYLMEATVRMFEPWPTRALAMGELVMMLVFFTAAIVVLRPLKLAAKARS